MAPHHPSHTWSHTFLQMVVDQRAASNWKSQLSLTRLEFWIMWDTSASLSLVTCVCMCVPRYMCLNLRNDSKTPHVAFLVILDTFVIHCAECTDNFWCHEFGWTNRWRHTIENNVLIQIDSNKKSAYVMSPRTSLAVFARDARSKSHSLAPSNFKLVGIRLC